MEEVRRARRPVRFEFTERCNELEAALKEESPDLDAIKVKYKLLYDAYEGLQTKDHHVVLQLPVANLTEEEEIEEMKGIMELKKKFEVLRAAKDKILPEKPVDDRSSAGSVSGRESMESAKLRNFKLPTIRMTKFSGRLEDWLAWWAQFQKIDEDTFMSGSDKFWYLQQALEPTSDAYQLASSYPQSNENYGKVIEALKKRYGNEDVLLHRYVRKLLNLVISNVKTKEKIPLKTLQIKLDSHLRALKTLKLEEADPATWLFPLVESSLPERVLDNWQRSNLSSHDASKEEPPRTRLDLLMEFLEKEVTITQRIEEKRDFADDLEKVGGHHQQRQIDHRVTKPPPRVPEKKSSVPTFGSFYNSDQSCCVFCGKNNHSFKKCYRAKEMSYEERMDIIRKKNLCYRCCGSHLSRDCKKKIVDCEICKRSHLTILCKELKSEKRRSSPRDMPPAKRIRTDEANDERPPEVRSSRACIGTSGDVSFQTLKIAVGTVHNQIVLRALIDTGCDRSYITKRAARNLKLKTVGGLRAIHNLFGGNQSSIINHNMYNVIVRSLESGFQLKTQVRDKETICNDLRNPVQTSPDVLNELHRNKIKLSDDGEAEVDFLIGGDLYPHILTGEFLLLKSGAAAIKTKLGWTVLGEVSSKSATEENMSSVCISMATNDAKITTLWDLETLGIREPGEQKEIAKKVELAKEKYVSSITRGADGRYIAKLPWKDDMPCLPSNKVVAFKRLESATKKLKETGMFQAYDNIFKEWEAAGFIEKVPSPDNAEYMHYLPHRPVIKKESLTTPVRPVFDASCRVGKAPSLNDCLFTGENYVLKILDILLRFREKAVAFISDIRKAFQMIGLHTEDRDFVRFLWWSDEERSKLVEYRHARVVFGVTCSPFILACVLHHHLGNLTESESEFGRELLSTLYVDNCVHSEHTKEEYHMFKKKAVELMSAAAMDLRMWQSNMEETEDESTRIVSVLGLLWDRKEDSLSINMKSFVVPEKVTKRTVLSTIQKIYDPIGFTSPGLLPMKILLQRTWQSKLKWDEEFGGEERKKFLRWCDEARDIGGVHIPRLSTNGSKNRDGWSFHVFGDASKIAYSSVVFIRVAGETTTVQLLCCKSRVAPVKELTIPKLELMAALLGVRLFNTVKSAMSVADSIPVYFYTDSTTVLACIQRADQWGTFVANRVKEIRTTTEAEQWRHVAGELNPADFPSRGCYPTQLVTSVWWNGPDWLYEAESEWPQSNQDFNEEEISGERRKTETAVSFLVRERMQSSFTFEKRVRIIGWVRRFLHNKYMEPEKRRSGPLSLEEIRRAEIIFIRDIQREEFTAEKRSKLVGLQYFEDEWGLLRVKTRLTYRTDLGDYRYPILLPHNREEVKQLVRDYHERHYHAGVSYLMPIMRNKFWITKARHTIRSAVFKCIRCKRFTAKPIIPAPAPLPLDRIKDAEVFEVVGVDLAGPVILKNGKKAWLVIFTCGVYRAVHFEAVMSLSAKAFIKALETFSEKYRRPAIIYSDNGTNFRGTQKLFRQINWNEVQQHEKMIPIEWKFNPATSSWWGGFWERLIRVAKDLLKRTVGRRSLNWSELKIALKEIGEVMNHRPLTHVSEDPADLEPLTPAVFLHPMGKAKLPEKEMLEGEKLRFRYNYMRKLKSELRGRFLKEYLAMLVNRRGEKPTRELGSWCLSGVTTPRD